MPHELSRFTQSLVYEPQFITQPLLEDITNYLEDRNFGNYIKAHEEATSLVHSSKDNPDIVSEDTTVGILRVEGNLTYKPTIFSALCGGTDYTTLIEQTKELCSIPDLSTIVMEVNSGGGMAYRMMESSREIHRLCNESGKRLIAYVDGTSASAAYGLSVAADEIIVNPDAMVGSIGAVVALRDTSEQDKKEGVKTIYITSANSKVPIDTDGSFKEEYLQSVQKRVEELGSKFVDHVASLREMDTSIIENTEARMFSAEEALELGLVDSIMEGEEFYTYLATTTKEEKEKPKQSSINIVKLEHNENIQNKPSAEEENLMTDTVEKSVDTELLAELQAKLEAQSDQLAAYAAKEVEAEKAELSSKLSSFAFLADSQEDVLSFLADSSVSDNHKALLNSVLDKAQAGISDVEEKAVESIAQAQLKTDEAVKEKDEIKQEFGEKENASVEAPKEELSHTDALAAKVKQRKAALAAKA